MPTIDAHQHFWQRFQTAPYNYEWLTVPRHARIYRDFMPDDLLPLIQSVGVEHTIFVQTQHHLEENRWALELAERYPFIAGVVGWLDLASEQCEDQLLEFKTNPKFVGARHITQDETDDNFIIRPEILRGLRVLEKHELPFDLLFYVKHLPHAVTLAQELPGLPMVIDHLSKPQIKYQKIENWLPHLEAAAKFPNMYLKLSGMVTEADWHAWKPADLKPYVQHALELFGPARCMFGSDWPVCELASSYSKMYQALVEALGPLSDHDRDLIFGGTAAKFYRLKLPA